MKTYFWSQNPNIAHNSVPKVLQNIRNVIKQSGRFRSRNLLMSTFPIFCVAEVAYTLRGEMSKCCFRSHNFVANCKDKDAQMCKALVKK